MKAKFCNNCFLLRCLLVKLYFTVVFSVNYKFLHHNNNHYDKPLQITHSPNHPTFKKESQQQEEKNTRDN